VQCRVVIVLISADDDHGSGTNKGNRMNSSSHIEDNKLR
jgi:hypothetical protein